jgi:hypothetical protein
MIELFLRAMVYLTSHTKSMHKPEDFEYGLSTADGLVVNGQGHTS